jgi:hypothetical protein
MIWGKRRFANAEYTPYFDKLEKLLLAQPHRYQQFLMVSTNGDELGIDDYYVGVPDAACMLAFDGFTPVAESDLPKEIDVFLIGDQTTSEFTSRFQMRGR